LSDAEKVILRAFAASFPIKPNDLVIELPVVERTYERNNLLLARMRPTIRGTNSRSYIVSSSTNYNGMCVIYIDDSKVLDVEFAFGTRQAGFSRFYSLSQHLFSD